MITEEQRKLRFKGIGGSDVAAIVGLSPWSSRMQLWEEKVRGHELSAQEPEEEYGPLWRGAVLEGLVFEKLLRGGTKVISADETYRHEKYPFLMAHLDGYVISDGGCLVEIKTAVQTAQGWGEPGTDQVPAHVLCQVTHAMTVTKASQALVAVLRGSRDHLHVLARMTEKVGAGPVLDAMGEDLVVDLYAVPYNLRLGSFLMEECVCFWNGCVVPSIPPVMEATQETRAQVLEMMTSEVMADEDTMEAVTIIRSARKEIKRLALMVSDAETRVKAFMGNRNTLVTEGLNPLARIRVSERTILNQKAVKQHLGEGWKNLCTTSKIVQLVTERDDHGQA